MKKNAKYRALSLLLAIVMIVSLLPTAVFATGNDNVYISVSFDGTYIDDKNGSPIAYIPVSFQDLVSINLNNYGLSEYLYDEDGDGTYEITALHLVIYAHENIYGGSWSDVDFTGAPGSSYFQGGIFGFDENLNYYLNGQYPLIGDGWGATSDQIVLEAGDFLDIASFSSWDFYQDSAYGFHFFADAQGNITHDYSVEDGTACDVKLIKGTKDSEYNSVFYDVPDYEVSYGTAYGDSTGTVTTDENGCASINFPSAGTWYVWCDGGYGEEYPTAIVSAPGYAKVTVTTAEEPEVPIEPDVPVVPDVPEEPETPDVPEDAQDVTAVLNATMAQLATTVTEPVFGTNAGEWTVLSLARGGYYKNDAQYFADYYNRIVETVNTKVTSVNMSGALHKVKSTENSRLIVALSAIGKDATSVGDWDLVEAYSANGFEWINKQGLNGTIWALIALDSNNYETSDPTIRQQCVDAIVAAQHDDGGWSLMANKTYASDPDITGMALTALYPYRDQPEVAAACEEAFACLSAMQHDNSIFASGGSECAESCAWVIVATTTWGINPDTDSRFIKNGNSVVDGLLMHYLEDEAEFQHIIGAGSNNMATDQSCYALVAYNRFLNNQPALFDYSDVTFEDTDSGNDSGDDTKPEIKLTAALGLPENVAISDGSFNATVTVDKWDNDGAFKLIDLIVTVPEGLEVTGVTAGDRLRGGEVNYNLDSDGKLRIVYSNTDYTDITISGDTFPVELFSISFKLADTVSANDQLNIAVSGMSVKLSSESMIVVDTSTANGTVTVAGSGSGGEGGGEGNEGGEGGEGNDPSEITYSATCLYTGDGIDLIPANKKAVAVAVTGIDAGTALTYNDGTNDVEFLYSTEITTMSGINTYVALVDSTIDTESFVNAEYYTIGEDTADTIAFGDANSDRIINAQDALNTVNAWLRKGDASEGKTILAMNVTSDGRINTYDALGIVESYTMKGNYAVVTTAATAFTQTNS